MDSYTRAAINAPRLGDIAPAGRFRVFAVWSALMAVWLFTSPVGALIRQIAG